MSEPHHRLRHGIESCQECTQERHNSEGERYGLEGAERGGLRPICTPGADVASLALAEVICLILLGTF